MGRRLEKIHIWLDDERPAPAGWYPLRSYETAKGVLWKCLNTSTREYYLAAISFDHDLGGERTGYDLCLDIQRMVHDYLLGPFDWYVHSMNPVGRANIMFAMTQVERLWRARGYQIPPCEVPL